MKANYAIVFERPYVILRYAHMYTST